MHRALLVLTAFLTLFSVPTRGAPPAGTWAIDPSRSLVGFTVTKLGFADVEARFTDFEGQITYDPDRPERSAVRWRVRVASVVTDDTRRDRAMQGAPYFDAVNHPELVFESRRVQPLSAGRLAVWGDITIKGHTRPISIIVSRRPGGLPGFETSFDLNRHDFDVHGGGMMRAIIGRRVAVRLVAVPYPSGGTQ